jgi:hypothetical protein
MRNSRRWSALFAVCGLLLAGCTSHAKPGAVKTASGCASNLPHDVLFIGGNDPFNAGLYRLSRCGGSPTKVAATVSRFSSVAAAGGHVVVAQAPHSVDQINLLKGDKLTVLPNGQMPAGFSPAIDNAGDVLYTALTTSSAKPFELVEVTANGTLQVLYRSANPLSQAHFEPAGRVVVLEQPSQPGTMNPARTAYLVVLAGKKLSRFPTDVPDVSGVVWAGSRHWLIVSSNSSQGAIYDDGTGGASGSLPSGWRSQAFDDQSGQLLVIHDKKLAVAEYQNNAWALTDLAVAMPVYGAAWD